MAGYGRHVLHQGPMLGALVRTALTATGQGLGLVRGQGTDGRTHEAVVPPRPPALVRDYLSWLGTDPARYAGVLPPHLFPQWGMPLLGRTLSGLPHPLTRILNAGCRLVQHGDIPADRPLHLAATLERVDDDGRRVLLHQHLATRTPEGDLVLEAWVQALIPLRRGGGGPRSRVGRAAEPVARFPLGPRAGYDYACLSGDFNPLHWVSPYARAAGFPGTPLHGFASLALAFEHLVTHRLDGDWRRLSELAVRFTRPLVLPAEVGLYEAGRRVWLGPGPGEPAWLSGTVGPADDA